MSKLSRRRALNLLSSTSTASQTRLQSGSGADPRTATIHPVCVCVCAKVLRWKNIALGTHLSVSRVSLSTTESARVFGPVSTLFIRAAAAVMASFCHCKCSFGAIPCALDVSLATCKHPYETVREGKRSQSFNPPNCPDPR